MTSAAAGGGDHRVKYDRAMVNTEPGGDASTSDIQAVSRVAQILGLFGPRTVELTAADVAERVGLNRTTAYRYCASMATAGILERGHRKGTFTLGGLVLQLGIHALHRSRVLDLLIGDMPERRCTAGTTAVLSVWGAHGPVVALVQEDTSRAVVVTVRPGTQLEMDAAQMRVFLAHHQDQKLIQRMMDELPAPRRAEVEAGVYAVRRTGYSLVSLDGGLYGAAAPVFDEHGITAAIALLGAEQVADLSAGSPVLTALVTTAAALSDQLSSREGEQQIARQR